MDAAALSKYSACVNVANSVAQQVTSLNTMGGMALQQWLNMRLLECKFVSEEKSSNYDEHMDKMLRFGHDQLMQSYKLRGEALKPLMGK
ncbi:hypothetical protein [Chromobacterium sp. ATCC 53434]|uniref:hypothetical protein n=1 Tax=Chromobacterium sp. (strain ATCC 53434 / SC 14030) TaxID=2059672 RepID=UPI001305192E|nr:hypothetical protein [Chromobacterium sp. ATCC 53434]